MNNNVDFLIFNYKFKCFMDSVCNQIVDKLNKYLSDKKNKQISVSLGNPGKKDLFFYGYYLCLKKNEEIDESIYIGLNWNFLNTQNRDKYFLSIDIKKFYFEDNESSDFFPYDIWYYHSIEKNMLNHKDLFIYEVVQIIEKFHRYFTCN